MPTTDPVKRARYQRTWYKKRGAASIRATARRHRERNREHVQRIKAETPCADCGERYPYYVMDFDHVGDDKATDIARLVNEIVSLKRLDAEIAKCEVVCANCHRVRSYRRQFSGA